MTFQLRRMLLVNAGTNKHVPSGRITELDPRGGAAVVGGNAVGKTSTRSQRHARSTRTWKPRRQ
jgi:hypothetical protein